MYAKLTRYKMVRHFLLAVYSVSLAAQGESFQFFNGEIDFWKSEQGGPGVEAKPAATLSLHPESGPFPWKQYLDPKNKEFFREGDYTPPEPFMEIVRNPTDDNLKMWFAYIEKKNDLAQRLQKRMQEFAEKNTPSIDGGAREELLAKTRQTAEIAAPAVDARRFRFRMYFDSQCPHCHRMFETLSDLQAHGFYVDARQIDSGTLSGVRPTVTVERASNEEIKSKDIQSVPLLLIGDLTKKAVYRLTGFKTYQEVLNVIHENVKD